MDRSRALAGLARVLYGEEGRPHLQTMRSSPLSQQVPDAMGLREYRIQSAHGSASKRLVESVRIGLGSGNAPLHVLIFNIKRLAAEAKKEARSRESAYQMQPSPRGRRGSFKRGGAAADPSPHISESIANEVGGSPASSADGSGEGSAAESNGRGSTNGDSSSDGLGGGGGSHRRVLSDGGGGGGHRRVPSFGNVPSDVAACQSALSFMCCWGVDAAFDAQCRDEIGLQPPPPPVTYGVRGHGGNFSFLTPRAQLRHHRWQCSSHLTALHSIAAVSLANTLMMSPGCDDVRNVCSSLVTHFSIMLPERLPSFCAPSLSLLARHYVDAVEEVQQVSRVPLSTRAS